jgi:hypothetical protein
MKKVNFSLALPLRLPQAPLLLFSSSTIIRKNRMLKIKYMICYYVVANIVCDNIIKRCKMFSKLARLLEYLPVTNMVASMKVFKDKIKRSVDSIIDKIKTFAEG